MSLGNRGHIGIKKETTWGERNGEGANDCFLPFVTEGLTRDIEDVISAIQRGVLDEPRSYQGEKAFGGPLVIEVHPVSIGHILRSALGAPAAAVAADTTETLLENCEDAWNEAAGVNTGVISGIDPNDKKKGTYSVKLQVTLGVAPDEILASEVIASLDMHLDTQIKFWIKSSVNCASGDLVIRLSENEGGATADEAYEDMNVPELVAGVWKECTVDITVAGDLLAVISIAIVMHIEKGEFTIHLDDVRSVVGLGVADVAKKHVFKPMQALTDEFGNGTKNTPLFPYTLEVFRDEGDAYEFLGCVVNTLAFAFSTTDKILKATCGIIAANAEYITKTGLGLETTNPFVWENARIYLAGKDDTIVPAATTHRYNDLESFSLAWDNKCVAKYALNNTAIPRKIIRTGYREIPISFTVDFTNKTEYDLFLAGTERQMKILFEGAKCGADAANTPYTLQFDIPLLRYTAWPINIGGPGRLSVAVTGKAKYDAAGYAVLFTLINDKGTTEYQEE